MGKEVWFSISFSSFFLYRTCKRLREFEEIDIEVTVNNKEENSYDSCLDFVEKFGLREGD
jgi:hypothetical protein